MNPIKTTTENNQLKPPLAGPSYTIPWKAVALAVSSVAFLTFSAAVSSGIVPILTAQLIIASALTGIPILTVKLIVASASALLGCILMIKSIVEVKLKRNEAQVAYRETLESMESCTGVQSDSYEADTLKYLLPSYKVKYAKFLTCLDQLLASDNPEIEKAEAFVLIANRFLPNQPLVDPVIVKLLNEKIKEFNFSLEITGWIKEAVQQQKSLRQLMYI